MKFYSYRPNNVVDSSEMRWWIIEANSPEEADAIAEEFTPVSFDDGTRNECPECGRRWRRQSPHGDDPGFDAPGLYESGDVEYLNERYSVRYYDGAIYFGLLRRP
jgi:hypothetical protein